MDKGAGLLLRPLDGVELGMVCLNVDVRVLDFEVAGFFHRKKGGDREGVRID